ncbi:N-formylglutamate amidohydrolase [Skermanella stibiiresistens SB22]|uniref:N-formylglutamate amidohydrolase n=1 Tax=Skermanella stibiiresistens SB22 TaxID=1385369 RepID=W9H1J3_9PROT|nr:N-formylglutamate amidohydrolase [Skermanella stibiiresistens]EWY39944.1 N-formylglutamate amidohydrolase [Skermanella stibiiresistens SB22]
MSFVIEDVLVRDDPVGEAVPLVLDSPHSGIVYPRDFSFVCPFRALRQAEDTHVDELVASAPEAGAILIRALFPRSYIDVNRAVDDIEPELLDGPWPEPLHPSDKSLAGMGLIRRLCKPGMPMYDGRLSVAQVAERIDRYYRPYHEQVAGAIDRLHRRFGVVYHLNCHSMPTFGRDPSTRPDFVLGDRDGTTCDPDFTRYVGAFLTSRGYRVRLNNPYKGVELVRRYSNPKRGIHSLQVEIHRGLYMNEETLEKNAGFDRLQSHLAALIRELADYARDATELDAAE